MSDATMTLIEYMPDELRASHEAAGNRGIWPHNGAERRVVQMTMEEVSELTTEWSGPVRVATEADLGEYGVTDTEYIDW